MDPATTARIEENARKAKEFFRDMEKADDAAFSAFQKWEAETSRQQEQLLDNLITRLERVRDSLRDDQIATLDLRTQQLAPASRELTAAQDSLSVFEQRKTNKLLAELVSFSRSGDPGVFG